MFMAAPDPSFLLLKYSPIHGGFRVLGSVGMTMFSPRNHHGYGGEGLGVMNQLQGCSFSSGTVRSDSFVAAAAMAEDDDLRSLTDGTESSSKDEEWLQLSIGGGGGSHRDPENDRKRDGPGLVELELMPTTSNNSSSHSRMRPEFRAPRPVTNFINPSFFLQRPGSSSSINPDFHHQEINWGFRPVPISAAGASSSPSSSFSSPPMAPPASYFPRPFQLYAAGLDMAAAVAAPPAQGVDFRVIQPPRRPHSGVWFMLQASQNQEKEPFLPQISRSYLRIKDGRMTIRLVLKYLVSKLSLENESEIEIRCKGQRLLPFLTLQHVRDNIWAGPSPGPNPSPREFITLLPNSSATHHIMVLHYARTTASSN